jgi:hypothetical protein
MSEYHATGSMVQLIFNWPNFRFLDCCWLLSLTSDYECYIRKYKAQVIYIYIYIDICFWIYHFVLPPPKVNKIKVLNQFFWNFYWISKTKFVLSKFVFKFVFILAENKIDNWVSGTQFEPVEYVKYWVQANPIPLLEVRSAFGCGSNMWFFYCLDWLGLNI